MTCPNCARRPTRAGIGRALRRAGIEEVPDQLTREQSAEGRRDLLLSQVCGSNLVGERREGLTYVATPCYTAPGCNGPLYRSVIVVPATCPAWTLEDLRGSRCAINGYRSHSGCNALRATFAPLAHGGRFFSSVTVSGGHALSLALMASGQADVAAIDCIMPAAKAEALSRPSSPPPSLRKMPRLPGPNGAQWRQVADQLRPKVANVKAWFSARPNIRVVSRDRGGRYGQAVTRWQTTTTMPKPS